MPSMETDDVKMEEILLKNGFNKKNITLMKKIIIRGGDPDERLHDIVLELKNRFIRGIFICVICFAPTLFNLISKDSGPIIAPLMATFIGLLSVYYVTPMSLAWKAYRFMRNNK